MRGRGSRFPAGAGRGLGGDLPGLAPSDRGFCPPPFLLPSRHPADPHLPGWMRTRATRAAAKAIRDVNRARFTVFGACPGLLCIVARVWTAPRRTCFMRGAFPRVVSCGSPPRALGCDAPLYFASLLSARRVGVGGGGLRRGRVRAGGGWHGSGVGWGLKFETEVDAVHTLRQCMAQSCLAATKQPSMALFESLLSHSGTSTW